MEIEEVKDIWNLLTIEEKNFPFIIKNNSFITNIISERDIKHKLDKVCFKRQGVFSEELTEFRFIEFINDNEVKIKCEQIKEFLKLT